MIDKQIKDETPVNEARELMERALALLDQREFGVAAAHLDLAINQLKLLIDEGHLDKQ